MARSSRGPDILGIFVKEPVAGQVKTRLAAELGVHRATSLYRRMGRDIVANCVRPAAYRTVVWYAPSGAGAAVRRWLGSLNVAAFLAQPQGDLADRLSAAVTQHFREGAGRVVIIGSDCPTVTANVVSQVFDRLAAHDVVLGPAYDGGFYLVGMNAPHPALFENIAWSTDTVLEGTKANAARLGLGYVLLPVHRDVDTVADAQALGIGR